MGWKSTTNISRARAIELIQARVMNATNEQLGNAMESLGYGDEHGLEYHGYNFVVEDETRADRLQLYKRLKEEFEPD